MTKLRPYQENLQHEVRKSLAQGHKDIVSVLATGGGKTVLFIDMATKAVRNGFTVLLITESKSLFNQTARYADMIGINAESNRNMVIQPNKIYISMAQTLTRRNKIKQQLNALGKRLLIIIDEVHIKTSCSSLDDIPQAIRLGFTATPHAKHLQDYFKHLVIGAQPNELIKGGWLTPAKYYERSVVDSSSIKIDKGEFDVKDQERVLNTETHNALVEDLNKFKYKKCIIFCASIRHCANVVEYLRAHNIQCSEVHSEVNELETFTKGDINVCVSVGMLTKGFDFPPIDLVVLYRLTTSLPLYLQMCGRGSRLSDNKPYWTLLDYGNNIRRFGFWHDDREWSLEPPQKVKKKDVESDEEVFTLLGIKACNKCGAIIKMSLLECPECGAKQPIELKKENKTELREVKDLRHIEGKRLGDLTAKELYDWVGVTGNKQLASRVARSKGLDYLFEYAKLMKYKEGWVKYQCEMSKGFTNSHIR